MKNVLWLNKNRRRTLDHHMTLKQSPMGLTKPSPHVLRRSVIPTHFCPSGVKTALWSSDSMVLSLLVTIGSSNKILRWRICGNVVKMAHGQCSKIYSRWTLDFGKPQLESAGLQVVGHLKQSACRICHPNLKSLKRSIVSGATKISLETVRMCMGKWPKRLWCCINNEGSPFWMIYSLLELYFLFLF